MTYLCLPPFCFAHRIWSHLLSFGSGRLVPDVLGLKKEDHRTSLWSFQTLFWPGRRRLFGCAGVARRRPSCSVMPVWPVESVFLGTCPVSGPRPLPCTAGIWCGDIRTICRVPGQRVGSDPQGPALVGDLVAQPGQPSYLGGLDVRHKAPQAFSPPFLSCHRRQLLHFLVCYPVDWS